MRTWFLSAIAGLGLLQGVWAADYTMLLDPSKMSVGQTVGENLIVEQDGITAEKYVTATSGRVGWLEIPVNIGSSFEIRIIYYGVWTRLNFYGTTGSLLDLV